MNQPPTSLLRNPPNLSSALQSLLLQIPPGKVASCGDIAKALGDVAASRFVGQWLNHDQSAAGLPTHRVVLGGGKLRHEEHDDRLVQDGIEVEGGKVDLNRHRFTDFAGPSPLAELRALQHELADKVELLSAQPIAGSVAGVDVSYDSSGRGTAAYDLVDAESLEVVWSTVVQRGDLFPYITSYLAFRELPLLLDLIEAAQEAGKLASTVFVDGSGVLHPRGSGIAAMLGAARGIRTIGVTKKHLCGEVDFQNLARGEQRTILLDDVPRGVVYRPDRQSKRPIFISPGNKIDVPSAASLAIQLMGNRSLPAPIYWADRISRQSSRSTAD